MCLPLPEATKSFKKQTKFILKSSQFILKERSSKCTRQMLQSNIFPAMYEYTYILHICIVQACVLAALVFWGGFANIFGCLWLTMLWPEAARERMWGAWRSKEQGSNINRKSMGGVGNWGKSSADTRKSVVWRRRH